MRENEKKSMKSRKSMICLIDRLLACMREKKSSECDVCLAEVDLQMLLGRRTNLSQQSG